MNSSQCRCAAPGGTGGFASSSSRSSACCSSIESTSAIVAATCCASTARHSGWRSAAALEATSRVVQVVDDTDEAFDGGEEIERARREREVGAREPRVRRRLVSPQARRASGRGARAGARAPTPWRARRRARSGRRKDARPWRPKRRGSAPRRAARTRGAAPRARPPCVSTAASLAGFGGGTARTALARTVFSPANNMPIVCCRMAPASRPRESEPCAYSTIATIGCDVRSR